MITESSLVAIIQCYQKFWVLPYFMFSLFTYLVIEVHFQVAYPGIGLIRQPRLDLNSDLPISVS